MPASGSRWAGPDREWGDGMNALAAGGVTKRLVGRAAVRDVSVSLEGGSIVGLLGPNGAGKSTLLRLLVGLLEPDAGRVLLDGRPLAALPDRERARRIAYLPQDGVVHWQLTVEAVVGLGRIPHRGGPAVFSGRSGERRVGQRCVR